MKLTSAARFEIIKLMLIETYPQETERLKRHEGFFEWITWVVLVASYLLTYLPLGVPVYRLGINLLFASVALTTLLAYRASPSEKQTGSLRYSFTQKSFLVSLSNHVFASIAIFFTGGINSPLWFIYIVALIGDTVYLPAWAVVVEGGEAIALYLLTVGILTPYFFGTAFPSIAQMTIVPVAALLSVILAYVVARDFNQQLEEHRLLAKRLKERAIEAIGERNKLNTVVASVVDGIFILDKERRFTFVNKAALEILQLAKEDLIDRRFDEVITAIDTQSNEQVKEVQICPSEVVKEDKLLFGPKELRVKIHTNKDVWIRLVSSGIKEGSDVDIGCICTFQDASKEKELEEMKLDFVAMAAHELRTPLTAVRGYLSILMEEMENKLSPEEQGWVKKAFVSSGNLAAL
ncbi:MAG TPA: PAS domain-containing protein, partial [Candidatus Nanoarchaeia archaeon]